MPNKTQALYSIKLIFLVLLLLTPLSFSAQDAVSEGHESQDEISIERGWEVLSGYYRDPGAIDRAIEITEGVLKREPDNVEALLFLSRLWLTYGYVKARTRQDLIRVFENGTEAARKALKIEPENPDAHFFYVANLASLGDTKGLFNSLFMLPEVRRELDTILSLDPDHANGLAMNGALYYYLPGILGGDLHISEIYIRRALSVDPHLSSARLYLAMNLMKQKRYDEAASELVGLINDREPSFYSDWYLNRKYAAAMLGQIYKKKKETAKKPNDGTIN